jgi:putative nucleotidyltransferase with HDIG domain
METHLKLTNEQVELFKYVQGLFNKPIYACGGCIRDILLGKTPKDYDFCSEMTTEEIKEQLKGKHKTYCIGEKFGTLGVKINGFVIEITTFRKEEYATHSRKPKVTFGTDLITDLSRRDFTINAIALNCQTLELVDPFNGQEDIQKGIIRAVGNAKMRFKEDPLRILRAVRFSTVLGFEIEEQTLKKMKEMVNSLMRISRERWVEEFNKILKSDNVYNGLKMLWEYRIFNFTLPELSIQWNYDQNSRYHNLQLWDHTAHVVQSAQKAGCPIEMLWACLLHDVGKPFTRTDKQIEIDRTDGIHTQNKWWTTKSNYIMHERVGAEIALRLCEYLKFSNKMKEEVVSLVRNHLEETCPLRVYDNEHKSEFNSNI